MSPHAEGLAVANVLVLLLGTGLLPILRLARTRRQLLARLPLAYAVGLAATGIIAVELALVGIAVGRVGLTLLAAAALALGLPGLPGGGPLRFRRPTLGEAGALALLAASLLIAVPAARLATVKALADPDEWQIWATRAKALYLVGHPAAPVFTDPSYPGLRQPILFPSLEALDFRFMGAFDSTLIHVQLFLFALAFVGAAWILLRPVCEPFLLAASLLAVLSTFGFADSLLANTPGAEAAILAALGLAALAAWLRRGDGALLAGAAVFLAAATLTSSAGECFALAALAAMAIVVPRSRLRALAIPAVFVVAIDLSWRLWLASEDLGQHDPGPGAVALWHAIWSTGSWSLLPLLFLVGLAGALVERHFRRVGLVASWLLLSSGALLLDGGIRVSSASVGGLLLGGTLLVPFLLHLGPTPEPAPAPARRLDPLASLAGRLLALGRRFRGAYGLPRRTPATLRTATGDGFPWRRPRRELVLLALVAAAALTPIFATNAQDASRICLTRALLHLKLQNDSCLSGPYARDYATYHGHLYSDKAPGMSLLEIPAVVIARIPDTHHWPYESTRLWFARLTTSGLALILCAFLIGRISEGLAPGYGGVSLVTFALGTLAAPLGVANFEHGTAGFFGLVAFVLAWRRRPGLAGLLAGAAVLVAYEAGLIAAAVLIYVLATQGRRAALRYFGGTLPGAVLLGVYNELAFGAPWHFSYSYVAEEFADQQGSGLFGIHLPYLHAIHLVFVGRGGLFVISPVVVAAGYGLVRLGRRFRAEAILCGAVVGAYAFLESGYFNPYGGLSPGPRFFVEALPFLALGLGSAFAAHFRLTSLLALLSLLPLTVLTLTWSVSAPDHGSIWHDIWVFPSERGSSWIVRALSSNVLESAGASRGQAAAFVVVAAGLAFALALPVTVRKRRAANGLGPHEPTEAKSG